MTKQRIVAEDRTWHDVFGKPQVGKFVRMHQGNVVISSGSRAIRVPFYRLSQPDREYVRELLAARGELAQLPPAMPTEPTDLAANQQAAEPQVTNDSAPESERPPIASAPRQPPGDRISGRTLPLPGRAGSSELARAASDLPVGPQHINHAREMSQRFRDSTNLEQPQVVDAAKPVHRLSLQEPKQIVGFIIGLPIVAAVVSLLTAVVLRAAAYMVSGDHLPYGEAYGTMFLSYIANGAIGFVFALALQSMTEPADGTNPLSLLMLPIAFFVQSGIISTRHETEFGPACLISLAVWLIWFAILFVVVLGVFLAFGVVPGRA